MQCEAGSNWLGEKVLPLVNINASKGVIRVIDGVLEP